MGKLARSIRSRMAKHLGIAVMRTETLYDWQVNPNIAGSHQNCLLPEGAEEYLRSTSPRLLELQQRYASVDTRATKPLVWTEGKLDDDELLYFRGDNPFVFQKRGAHGNELSYALAHYYLRSQTDDGLLNRIGEEDGAFGAFTFDFDGINVSRDVLDSIGEISFLRNHVGFDDEINVMDIGAGYGRLAHRLTQADDRVNVWATDAFAASSFLAEYYLRYRGADRATMLPLDEVDECLEKNNINVATNIHSFSECTSDAIDWWVGKLASHNVPYLFVVPNGNAAEGTIRCRTNDGVDMEEVFRRHGYCIKVREPRYSDLTVQKYAVDPAQFNLFELR